MKTDSVAGDRFALVLWILLVTGFALGSVTRQLFMLLAIIAIPVLWTRRRLLLPSAQWRRLGYWWLLAFIPMLIAQPDAVDFDRSLRYALRYIAYFLAGSLLFLWAPAATDRQRFILFSGGLLGLLLLDGLLQAVLGTNLSGRPLYEDIRYGYRVTGFLGVDFGWVMAVCSPFVLEAARMMDSRGRLYWLAIPLLFVALLLSGSRASLLVMGLGFAAYAALLTRADEPAAARRFLVPMGIGILVGIAAIAVSPTLLDRWGDALGVFALDATAISEALSMRPALWSAAVTVFGEHWINGVGVRGFAAISEPLLQGIGLPEKAQGWSTHLNILDVAAELGVIGLIAYGVFYASLLRWLWAAPSVSLAPGLAAVLALFPLGATLPFFSMRVAVVSWVCMSMALALTNGDQVSHPERDPCAG